MEQRTLPQNNAIHLYLEQVAEALNDSGYDIKKTLESYKMSIPWTKDSAKTLIWKEVQKSMFGKEHTADLNKQEEINKVYEVINRFLGELGIDSIPFPSNGMNGENE